MEKIKSKNGYITVDEYLKMVQSFHSYAAPGVVIGGFMVNLAFKNLKGKDVLLDAVAETEKCLPDSIQLLTPCTVGNGWLKVFNLGRFALTLYDKNTGNGVRVCVNPDKLEKWPELKDWFFKNKPKKDQNTDLLMQQILEAGDSICDYKKVKVDLDLLKVKHRPGFKVCSVCGESYPAADGEICLGCQGKTPYLVS